jgi:hypothetical protein
MTDSCLQLFAYLVEKVLTDSLVCPCPHKILASFAQILTSQGLWLRLPVGTGR